MVGSYLRPRAAAVLAALLGCAVAASAAGTESAAAGAQLGFANAAVFAPRFTRGLQVQSVSGSPLSAAGLGSIMGGVVSPGASMLHMAALGAQGQVSSAKAPSQEVDLKTLLNRHLKTSLTFQMGGKTVWVSGSFDRAQKAYVSILEEGKAARFYNVESLLTSPGMLDIGSIKVKLSLSPDLSDQLESEIVLTNTANRKDQQRITLRDMLAAVSAAGEPAKIGGEDYRLFYYDDIKDSAADPNNKAFAFILTDAKGEFHVFLVPAELVPGDKIAVFKMHDNAPAGLQQAGGKLRIFDNP
jgi:hypothetical protein